MEVWFLGNKYNTETIQYFLEMLLYSNSGLGINLYESSPDDENNVSLGTITDDELPDSECKILKLNFIQLSESLKARTDLCNSTHSLSNG